MWWYLGEGVCVCTNSIPEYSSFTQYNRSLHFLHVSVGRSVHFGTTKYGRSLLYRQGRSLYWPFSVPWTAVQNMMRSLYHQHTPAVKVVLCFWTKPAYTFFHNSLQNHNTVEPAVGICTLYILGSTSSIVPGSIVLAKPAPFFFTLLPVPYGEMRCGVVSR